MLVEVADLLLNGALNSTQGLKSVPLFVSGHYTAERSGIFVEGHDLVGETLEAGFEAGNDVAATCDVVVHANIQISTKFFFHKFHARYGTDEPK